MTGTIRPEDSNFVAKVVRHTKNIIRDISYAAADMIPSKAECSKPSSSADDGLSFRSPQHDEETTFQRYASLDINVVRTANDLWKTFVKTADHLRQAFLDSGFASRICGRSRKVPNNNTCYFDELLLLDDVLRKVLWEGEIQNVDCTGLAEFVFRTPINTDWTLEQYYPSQCSALAQICGLKVCCEQEAGPYILPDRIPTFIAENDLPKSGQMSWYVVRLRRHGVLTESLLIKVGIATQVVEEGSAGSPRFTLHCLDPQAVTNTFASLPRFSPMFPKHSSATEEK